MIITAESNSGHWYTADGQPSYTRIAKNGNVRATTLRDAKKEGLLPSVTTIIGSLAKPGLDRWKQEQVLLASLTLPRGENEPEADWLKRVTEDSRATGRDAMDRGTNMHNVLEAYFTQVYMPQYPNYTQRTETVLREHFGDQFWHCEKSFAHELGFAGKCDLYSDEGIVVDFKTKESLENAAVYTEHILQLSAYAHGLNMPDARCAIVFVSETETQVHEIDKEDLQKHWKMFQCLLTYFRIKNNLSQG
jgi:hypothetical protein